MDKRNRITFALLWNRWQKVHTIRRDKSNLCQSKNEKKWADLFMIRTPQPNQKYGSYRKIKRKHYNFYDNLIDVTVLTSERREENVKISF